MLNKKLCGFFLCCFMIILQFLIYFKYQNLSTFSKNIEIGILQQQTPIYDLDSATENEYKGIFGVIRHMDVEYNHNLHAAERNIAIGMAITSQKTQFKTTKEILFTFPFFKTFMPSFCRTVSTGYNYNFFLAYDNNDSFFSNDTNAELFSSMLQAFTDVYCTNGSSYSVHFIKCSYNGEPTRSQNDAMMEAYMSNMEYYFRINDDTRMDTANWTEQFITTLKGFDPPYIGVVGPRHFGGNENILTYDFVHKSHFNIHGFYYPRIFKDWYADDWITNTYLPNRSVKLQSVKVYHTLEIGTRYTVREFDQYLLSSIVNDSQKDISRYVNSQRSAVKPTGDKIVSISLAGTNPSHLYGTIRNAQLIKSYLQGWILRVYIPPKISSFKSLIIPKVVLYKLEQLGAELVYVKPVLLKLDPSLWKYLVVDENDTLNYFMVKNPENRIRERDQLLVEHWMQRNKTLSSLCVKELYKRGNFTFRNILIGGNNPTFKKALEGTIEQILTDISLYNNNFTNMTEERFLNTYIWPRIKQTSKCYNDSGFVKNGTLIIKSYMRNNKISGFSTLYDEFDQVKPLNISFVN